MSGIVLDMHYLEILQRQSLFMIVILKHMMSTLIKLFYPLVNRSMGYSFSKGYYPRYADNKLNGRVTRLLVTFSEILTMLF